METYRFQRYAFLYPNQLINLNDILPTTTPLILIFPTPLLRFCSILQSHPCTSEILTHLLLILFPFFLHRHNGIPNEKDSKSNFKGSWHWSSLQITFRSSHRRNRRISLGNRK